MGLVFFLTGTEDPAERRETDPAAADSLLTLHDQVVGTAISDFGGRVARSLPEGVFAVFPPDADWPGCAIEIQKRVCSPDTMPDGPLPVRIAIHAGSALERGGEIFGRVVDRARRILDTASAGQIVLSREAAELCSVPEGASLRDLGVQRLKDLGEPERLYDLIGPDTPVTDFPPICTLADLPNNLPTQLTPFIGRTEELTKLTDLLADPGKKLVTLVGRGGSGKSRLALQAAAEASDDFPDGVWFVPLETSENTDQMVGAIADSIGYAFRSSDMVNELLEHIGRWATLIVLDSYDHLTTLSAGVPREILMGASRAKILITSRERLRVRGEQVVEVGGMQFTDSGTLEDMKSDAVRLFLETASKVTADPMDSPAEVSAIVGVCSALRGLPLAIELTSSWTRHMGIKEILSKITEPGFLRGEAATEPHGQAGISAVLDYSWRFLPEDEKIAFESVSVFRGMFDKLAAKAVADARFGQLVALVDKSLVQQTGTGRFVMHPLVRQHGRTKLEAHPQRRLEVERRHSEYYLGLLAAREPELLQGERSTAVIGLERELQNIELAWTSAAERSDWSLIESTHRGLTSLLAVKGLFGEADRLLGIAIDAFSGEKEPSRALLANLLAQRGWAGSHFRPMHECTRMLEMSIDLFRQAGDDSALVYGLSNYADILNAKGEDAKAARLYAESLELQRKLGDPHGVMAALNNLGVLAQRGRDLDRAETLYREAMEICRQQDNQHGVSVCLTNLAAVSRNRGMIAEAEGLLEEALAIEERVGDEFNQSLVRCYMVELLIIKDRLDDARSLCMRCLKCFEDLGHPWGVARTEILLSLIAIQQGRLIEAGTIILQALRLMSGSKWPHLYTEVMAVSAELLAELGRSSEARTVATVAVSSGPLQQYFRDRVRRLLTSLRQHLELDEEREAAELGLSLDKDGAISYVWVELETLLGRS